MCLYHDFYGLFTTYEEVMLVRLYAKLDNTHPQAQPANNEFNMTSCFANVWKKFTMSKFVGVVYEKQKENINKISSDTDKRFDKFQKEMSKPGSATISINPNKYNIEGEAIISNNSSNSNSINRKDKNRESTISINPRKKQKQGKVTISNKPRHTSKANANNQKVDDDDNLSSTDDDTEIHHLRYKKR